MSTTLKWGRGSGVRNI